MRHPLDNPAIPEPEAITSFRGEHGWLSNFAWCTVMLDGVKFPSVEHAYCAAKTTDPAWRERIAACTTPGQAKRLGRKAPLREGWEAMRLPIMADLLAQKFAHPRFRGALLATGRRALIEGNHWGDTFWGVCRGEGQNWLGRLLMDIREANR